MEFALIAVRGDSDQYMQLFAISSECLVDFFLIVLCQPLSNLVTRIEAYCLAGIEGKFFYLLSVSMLLTVIYICRRFE